MALPPIPQANAFVLRGGRTPACLLDPAPAAGDGDGLVEVDLHVADGRVAGFEAPPGVPAVDLAGALVWPAFVDVHTHLDKGHIWPRADNPDGSFDAALAAVAADREANWSARDVARRMAFGLRCAYAHGTAAVRTHLDSFPPHDVLSWEVFAQAREEWAGRIALQAVTLVTLDCYAGAAGERLADRVVATPGGVLGGVAYMHPDLDAQLDRVFALAAERGLDLDFHVDESLDPTAQALLHIARARLRSGFAGRVLCGHCCSLATWPPHARDTALRLVAEADLAVVSLPMCNLYLQDRAPGRTPLRRGVTLLHELVAAGVPVMVASDNCRDPFYAYGDHDPLEVFREAVRIAHLDRPLGAWPRAVTATPAAVMGLGDGSGLIGPGRTADLVLFAARRITELLARPQADRVVLRNGRALARELPDYAELDDLVG